MNEWMNEQMNEYMTRGMNGWMNDQRNEWINTWPEEWMTEWMNDKRNGLMSKYMGSFQAYTLGAGGWRFEPCLGFDPVTTGWCVANSSDCRPCLWRLSGGESV